MRTLVAIGAHYDDVELRSAAVLGISDVNFFDFKSLYWYKEGTNA